MHQVHDLVLQHGYLLVLHDIMDHVFELHRKGPQSSMPCLAKESFPKFLDLYTGKADFRWLPGNVQS